MTADEPLPARGPLTVACSRCGSVTRVGLVEFLALQFPVGAWLPGRTFDRWMTCPACRRRTWTSVTLRPVTAPSWRRPPATDRTRAGDHRSAAPFQRTVAYALIGFLAFAEAALMVGFFIPGETAVVVGGVLAGLGQVGSRRDDRGRRRVRGRRRLGRVRGREGAGPWLVDAVVHLRASAGGRDPGPARALRRSGGVPRAVHRLRPGGDPRAGRHERAALPAFLFWNVLGGICWGVGYTMLGYVVGVSFQQVLDRSVVASRGRAVVVVAVVVVSARAPSSSRIDDGADGTRARGWGEHDVAARTDEDDGRRRILTGVTSASTKEEPGRRPPRRGSSDRGARAGRSGRGSRHWPGAA